MHEVQPLVDGVTEILGDMIRFFRYNAKSYYGDNLFFISIVMSELKAFQHIPRIVMLDSDLKFLGDIANLWDQFDKFSETAVIGIAHEQQPVYRHVFRYIFPQTRFTHVLRSGITDSTEASIFSLSSNIFQLISFEEQKYKNRRATAGRSNRLQQRCIASRFGENASFESLQNYAGCK